MAEHTDPLASNSQHIIRKRTRNGARLANHSSTFMNGQEDTHVNGPSTSVKRPLADCSLSTQDKTKTSVNESCDNQPPALALYGPAPFSDDPVAVKTRAECDYSIKITKEMAASGTAPRPVRVYADGIYDLFHQGHARLLMQAKNAFPSVHLIAGVHSDFLTHQNKGKTVMTDDERYEVVRHCRYVDEVIKDADWIPFDTFLEENKIDFVAHDAIPYKMGSQDDIYKHLKAKGMFVATERTEGVSTSDLVVKIVREYDMYVRRNLDRGYTGKDMNLSFLNEKKFLFQNKMEKLMENVEGNKQEMLYEWLGKAKKIINNFLDLLVNNSNSDFIWNGCQSLTSAPNGSLLRTAHASSEEYCPMDARSTLGAFTSHLTFNYAFLFAILLFSLYIHLLT